MYILITVVILVATLEAISVVIENKLEKCWCIHIVEYHAAIKSHE